MFKRVLALIFIFGVTSAAWWGLALGTQVRTQRSYTQLEGAVGELWGTPQCQMAPEVYRVVPRPAADGGAGAPADGGAGAPAGGVAGGSGQAVASPPGPLPPGMIEKEFASGTAPRLTRDSDLVPSSLASSDVRVSLGLDYRKKGLIWFSTYTVDFSGAWTAANSEVAPGDYLIVFRFPTTEAIYDSFSFTVDGLEANTVRTSDGSLQTVVHLDPGEKVSFAAAYSSRGLDAWTYSFGPGVTQIRDFTLNLDTNFKGVDFPPRSISPTSKVETAQGWSLTWHHENLISGFQVGVEMPPRPSPGPLASRISFFAPVSLLFFFFVLFVLGILRGVNLHPMHYFFLAAAFFSFHLLFAYLVDRVDLDLSFAIASLVSVGLVVSYLRLIAGNRFAFVEAGLAQLVYLVFFSYVHFLEGYVGLAVTVASILTLFVMMQATARVDWNHVFGGPGAGGRGSGGGSPAAGPKEASA